MSESGSAVHTAEEKTATAKAVYILYVVGWILPIIAHIVGVIFAYIHRDDAPPPIPRPSSASRKLASWRIVCSALLLSSC